MVAISLFTISGFSSNSLMSEFISLTSAAWMTVSLALSALIFGLLLAILFALWESSRWRSIAWTGTAVVTLLRGLPEILVVLFVYYAASQFILALSDGFTLNLDLITLPVQLQMDDISVNPFICGVIALSILYASYASQTLRGALKAIPTGQWESGQALGMRPSTIFLRLIIPQMWRHALPGLSNQWLVLLKDTALISLISVNDIMLQTKNIAIRTQEPFTWYLVAAAIYLVITLLSQIILAQLTRQATRFDRGPL